MAAPIRVGFIGCGRVTLARHLPALAATRDARVVAVCDALPGAAAAAARATGARIVAEPAAVLADGDVDVVAICVPPVFHAELAISALECGRITFLEKPLALDFADGARVAAAAQQSTGALVLGLNLRHHPLVREGRRLVADGAVGRVRRVETRMTSTEKSRDAAIAGILHDLGPHHFDLWHLFSGEPIVRVEAVAHEDGIVVAGEGAAGAELHSVLAQGTVPLNEVEIVGDAGTLRLSLYRYDGLVLRRHGRARRGDTFRRLPAAVRAARSGGVFAASFRAQWRHVAAVGRGLASPEAGAADGLRALELAVAAEASQARGTGVAAQRVEA